MLLIRYIFKVTVPLYSILEPQLKTDSNVAEFRKVYDKVCVQRGLLNNIRQTSLWRALTAY
jgi:hypothetical protein